MFLKNIELSGFKSFADKVILDFGEKISAVIGPNGSGKSNIVDAMKWVLGEQSVKTLRGKSMEEVIFNGTSTRKPLSRANVSITLSNDKGVLPIAFKEITISRQLYRSGESKYLINNSECRLKDVLELFMDTGLSKGSYSIISQGQIGTILTANPYERRNIFEEAAGIVKYKTRKKIAFAKLEAAKQDLLRVGDILIELERQLRSLKFQAAKAERYKSFAAKLEFIEIFCCSLEYDCLKSEIEKLQNERQIYLDKKIEIETAITKKNSEYETDKLALIDVDNNLTQLSSKLYELNETIKHNEYRILNNAGKIDNCNFKINQYNEEIKELNSRISGLDLKINEENTQLLNGNIALLEAEIDNAVESKRLNEIEIGVIQTEQTLDTLKQKIFSESNKAAEHRAKLSSIQTELNSIRTQKSDISADSVEYTERRLNLIEESKILNENLEKVDYSIIEIAEKLKEMQQSVDSCANHIDVLNKKQFEYKNLLLNARADLKVIIDSEDDKYNDGLKEFLEFVKNKNVDLKKCGIIGEYIKTNEIYEIAIGNALNEVIQILLVENADALEETVNIVKDNSFGKVRFLDKTDYLKKKSNASKNKLSNEKGVAVFASDIIEIKNADYKESIKAVFDNIVIVEKFSDGYYLSRQYTDFIFITFDGIIFWNDGSITAGSVKENRNILKRDRQKEELRGKIEYFDQSLSEIVEHINEYTVKLNDLQKNIELFLQKQRSLEIEKANISNTIERNIKVLNEIDNELKKLDDKKNNLSAREEKLIIEEKQISGNLLLMAEASEQTTEKIKQLVEKNIKIKEQRDDIRGRATAHRIKSAELKQRQESLKRAMFDQQMLIEDYSNKILTNQKNIEETEKEIFVIKSDTEKINNEMGQFIKEREKWMIEKNTVQRKRDELTVFLSEKEEFSKNQMRELNIYQNKIHEFDIALSQRLTKNEGIVENIFSRYSIDAETFKSRKWFESYDEKNIIQVENKSISELKDEIRGLEIKIKSIGPVNINAIDEYKEVEQRYLFLQAQKKDLETAEKDLINVITKINDKAQQKFLETFNRVNKNFKEIISELFNGGVGELTLIDENDILESGIEISVRPPGKKIINIMSLSGGEQAMSAIGLLFALFKEKPSPFCILDEIDAPLDDANLTRFLNILKKFAEESQFIIITHHKKTMAACDVLYGVTMEEKGVSKILSVRISNNKNDVGELAG